MYYRLTFFNCSCICLLSLHDNLEIFEVGPQLLDLGLVKLFGGLEFLYCGQSVSKLTKSRIAHLLNQETSTYVHQYSVGI